MNVVHIITLAEREHDLLTAIQEIKSCIHYLEGRDYNPKIADAIEGLWDVVEELEGGECKAAEDGE